MRLRKCPNCKETVGADSMICPRCGASFRLARLRRILFWLIVLSVIAWVVARYFLKII